MPDQCESNPDLEEGNGRQRNVRSAASDAWLKATVAQLGGCGVLDGLVDVEYWSTGWPWAPCGSRKALRNRCGELERRLHTVPVGGWHGIVHMHRFPRIEGRRPKLQYITKWRIALDKPWAGLLHIICHMKLLPDRVVFPASGRGPNRQLEIIIAQFRLNRHDVCHALVFAASPTLDAVSTNPALKPEALANIASQNGHNLQDL